MTFVKELNASPPSRFLHLNTKFMKSWRLTHTARKPVVHACDSKTLPNLNPLEVLEVLVQAGEVTHCSPPYWPEARLLKTNVRKLQLLWHYSLWLFLGLRTSCEGKHAAF